MQTIDQPKYDDWKSKQNGDPYSLECFNFAERWANVTGRRTVAENLVGCAFWWCLFNPTASNASRFRQQEKIYVPIL